MPHKHSTLTVAIASAALAVLAACGETAASPDAPAAQPPTPPPAKPLLGEWGYPLEALDLSVDPGDDFYTFANGAWLRDTTIPGDRSGVGFSVTMRNRNETRIAEIIDTLSASNPAPGSEGQKIRDLYLSYMDVDAVEAAGLAPIEADLAALRALETHADVAAAMTDPRFGAKGPFFFYVNVDSRAPSEYAVWAAHDGLGLPDRSYYFRESDRLEGLRASYQAHIADMLILAGAPPEAADAKAAAVYTLERAIAERHWEIAARRDVERTYNKTTVAALSEAAPGFDFARALGALGLGDTQEIIVRELDAFPALAALFAETPVEVWSDYLVFHTLTANAPYLASEIDETSFGFFGAEVEGQSRQRPRDRRGVDLVNTALSQAVGKIYIERYFSEESKRQMVEMYENIRRALSIRIDTLSWMQPETKAAAQRKLAAMKGKIAYPEKWRDYSGVEITADSLIANIKALRAEAVAWQAALLNEPVDTDLWFRPPQTVNAFYSASRNEVFIPAGYIQSPLFDSNADRAVNYGAIGSIIGHEIGHGFDDQGSKFDADGTLRNWWTEADREAFDALGDDLVEQFNQYEPLPGLNVNGRLTLGENIGDLAGVQLAYDAYVLSLNGEEAPRLDGFTGPQRVFLGRAQARRYKRTEASLRQRLLSDPHSPLNLRVNGIVRNMDEWYEAFDVDPDDALYLPPEERVKIW